MALPTTRSVSPQRRWDPLQDFEDLYAQMGRLVPAALRISETTPWIPAADVSETDDAYIVEVELPGVKREDIGIEVFGNELTITGEVKERERVGLLRRRARRVGEFEYRASLPRDVDADNIEATLSEGVLTVRVPKGQRAKPRRIEISQRWGASEFRPIQRSRVGSRPARQLAREWRVPQPASDARKAARAAGRTPGTRPPTGGSAGSWSRGQRFGRNARAPR